MSYKWKPSATQRRAFAEKMQDPGEQKAYLQQKEDKAEIRRNKSRFDYESAGGQYKTTAYQYDFCMKNNLLFETGEEQTACNMIISAFICNEKTSHDYIHVVNEKIRTRI